MALMVAGPAMAQDEVQILSDWTYGTLYSSGWSVENMFDTTEIIDTTGEEIGDVENVIFSNDGKVLGIVAEVGGFWDIGDTHVFVPWDEVMIGDTIQQAQVPVTEAAIEDYDGFSGYWGEEQVITEADTNATTDVDDNLVAGAEIFKATDLIGDFVHLNDGARYGYVSDIIVENGAISAIVIDAASYGRRGYYAYPYYRGGSSPASPRYDMPYGGAEVDPIENFDYEQLRSRVVE